MSDCFVTQWTAVSQAPPSMGFPREEYWSGMAFFFYRESSQPRDRILSLASPTPAGGFFTTESPKFVDMHSLFPIEASITS